MSDDNFGPWIDWAGGECPIPNTRAGEWWLRWKTGGEERAEMDASDFVWVDRGPAAAGDIVAYRVRLPADDLLRQAIEALRLILPMARNYSAKNINKTAVKHLDAASAVLTAYDKREQS